MDPSKRISLAFGGSKPAAPRQAAPHSGTKRPRAALQDSDDEDDLEGKHQEITHFDISAGGAIDSKNLVAPKQPLVIPVPAKKRQKSGLPNQTVSDAEIKAVEARTKTIAIKFGLNITKKSPHEDENDGDGSAQEAVAERVEEKTLEERALSALMGEKVDSGAVIPTLTEGEAFHRDYDYAPDVPTEADYDAVPIEEFGAAMLRGMGWKDGETIGKKRGQKPMKPRVIERRPDLLGVGAKPAQALGIELGEWGKGAKKHDKKMAAYLPVVLKNKKTGEMLTEDELKQKMKQQEEQQLVLVEEETRKSEKRLEYRSSKPPRRRDSDEALRRVKERRHDSEKNYDDRKHSSSRRERESSVDSRHRRKERRERSRSGDRRHRREDEYDRRDKDRRQRDRSVTTEDRQKSRKHDDRHRDRDQDRDRKYRDEGKSSQRDRSDKDRRRDRDR
jgi:hypothetical protein